jgi:hypothetical protein
MMTNTLLAWKRKSSQKYRMVFKMRILLQMSLNWRLEIDSEMMFESREFEEFLIDQWIIPRFAPPGNHLKDGLVEEWFNNLCNWKSYVDSVWASYQVVGILLICSMQRKQDSRMMRTRNHLLHHCIWIRIQLLRICIPNIWMILICQRTTWCYNISICWRMLWREHRVLFLGFDV